MASKSRASMANPSAGTVVRSFRKRSAPQSKSVKSTAAPVAWMTLTACGMTSLPMPSPGMTAMRFLGAFFESTEWNVNTVAIIEYKYGSYWSSESGWWIGRGGRGVLRGDDGGAVWRSAGGVCGAAKRVRSVRPRIPGEDFADRRRSRALAERDGDEQHPGPGGGARCVRLSAESAGAHSGRFVCV